ncbi:uncharacterized protein [Phaseolus vulgaris]|uniref:uncharacterized protein n=1 Tax=Phaseolus vulgaris TaxID=3885 RepID=UPI0035CB0B26
MEEFVHVVFDEIIHSDQGSTKVYAEEYEQNITLEKLESCLEKQPIYSTKQQVEILQQEELPKEWRIPRDLSVDNIIGCKWVFRNKLDESEGHVATATADLEELFATISKYRLKLNPEKCVFGVEAGKFLGFMLTERGIEENPDKCATIIAMRSPTSVKEVQQLTGRMAALSRFVSAGGEKGHPYFQCLKRNSRFASFIKLKEYLATPPVLFKPVAGVPLRLYFAVTERAISSVLVQEQDQVQRPIYFVSKALQGPETRYQSLEKAALAVVFSARRLRHYFHSLTVVVMTNLPIQKVLQKPDVAGRMVRWAVELSEFDIQYEPKGFIKGQVYADFVAELSPGGDQEVESGSQWLLSVDGSSNQQGSGAGIVLEGPNGVLIEQALRFAFKASNNQAEYEALIAGMLLAKEMGAQNLLVKNDSQLITGQVSGEFQAKDPQMAAYLRYVQLLKGAFSALELVHVPRDQNARADLLAKLASSGKGGRQRTVIQETLKAPRKFVEDNRVDVLHICTARGRPRSHRSLTQDTMKTPRISTYADAPEEGKCTGMTDRFVDPVNLRNQTTP